MTRAMMMRYDTVPVEAPPAAPSDGDSQAARSAPQIDLDRVVWDQEYREEILEALKAAD